MPLLGTPIPLSFPPPDSPSSSIPFYNPNSDPRFPVYSRATITTRARISIPNTPRLYRLLRSIRPSFSFLLYLLHRFVFFPSVPREKREPASSRHSRRSRQSSTPFASSFVSTTISLQFG